jgi:hypothetical protein
MIIEVKNPSMSIKIKNSSMTIEIKKNPSITIKKKLIHP